MLDRKVVGGRRPAIVFDGLAIPVDALDLRTRAGEGAGACQASGLLRAAVRVRNQTGPDDAAPAKLHFERARLG